MFNLAVKNISRRLASSALSVLIVFIAVFSVVLSMAVITATDKGLVLSRERLGADLMVLPAGASAGATQVLFTAAPINVYLDETALGAVAAVEGVQAVAAQFFTQTVDQSCCSVVGVTRVVGIDYQNDFTVVPWLEGRIEALGEDGILVGASAPRIEGGQASILGEVFYVRGYLQPTGTSVDETIFMDIHAARRIAMASPYLSSVWEGKDASQSISCIMVKVQDGVSVDSVSTAIVESYPGIIAVSTSQMVANVDSQLRVVQVVSFVMLCLLVLLAALALAGRISATVSNRLPELGLLRTMGASKKSVTYYLVCEIGLLIALGAVAALIAGCLCSYLGLNILRTNFQLPLSQEGSLVFAVSVALVFTIILGAICLAGPLSRVVRHDPLETLLKGSLQ